MAPRKTAAPAKKTSRAKAAAAASAEIAIDSDAASASFDVRSTFAVRFTRNAFTGDGAVLAEIFKDAGKASPRVFAVVDYNVARQTPGLPARMAAAVKAAGAEPAAKPVIVPGGEAVKTDGGRTVWALANSMLEAGVGRGDCVFAIGGGSVLDAAGFAAALLHGGVNFVRFPATLLAQCAASAHIYSETGTSAHKSAFRSYALPLATVCDFDFLTSLTPENFRNGLPEAIRNAALADKDLLSWIPENAPKLFERDADAAEELVRRSVAAGMKAIAASGGLQPRGGTPCELFGSWPAARLQEMSRWRLWYGFALAVGMCIDSAYAVQKGWLSEEDGDAIGTALYKTGGLYGLERFSSLLENVPEVLRGLDSLAGGLRGPAAIAFPGPVGSVRVENDIDARLYGKIAKELRDTAGSLAASRRAQSANRPAPEPAPDAPAAQEPEGVEADEAELADDAEF